MECDSTHALIERRVKSRDIYLPSDYIKVAKECKKTEPFYNATILDHFFFKDYSSRNTIVYKSIRPGQSSGDPTVNEIKALMYNPTKQIIEYKLYFDDEYKPLPIRPNRANFTKHHEYKRLYQKQIPLTLSKFDDLKKLKHVLPKDTHYFYDSLPTFLTLE